jgi:hypothetical protein
MTYSSSWKARILDGIVQYNQVNQPTPDRSKYELGHCDGGDFTFGRSEGYPDVLIDGGNFTTGQTVATPSPLNVDGGRFE